MTEKDFIFNSFTNSMSSVAKVNLEDDTIVFIKNTRSDVEIGKKYNYSQFMQSTINAKHVVEEDIEKFTYFMDINHLRKKCEEHDTGEIISFRYYKNGETYWARLFICVGADYSSENANILLARRDLQDYESEDQRMLRVIDEKSHRLIASNTNQAVGILMGEKVNFSMILKSFTVRSYINILSVISFFVKKYNTFFVVDLERDEYFSLKIDENILNGRISMVGKYSQNIIKAVQRDFGDEAVAIFGNLDSVEKIRRTVENRMNVGYTFTDKKGEKLILHVTKIESYKSNPIKVLFRIGHNEEGQKLKVKTFGNFEVYDSSGKTLKFTRDKSKQLLAYLIDNHGYKVSTRDIVVDVLEKDENDKNAIKYVSTLINGAISDIKKAGYTNVIIKGRNSFGVNVDEIDCDYYRFLNGNIEVLDSYHNEYMKDYSWAEDTNAEIMNCDL